MRRDIASEVTSLDDPLPTQAVLWLLVSLCNLNRVPFDARLVERAFPPPHQLGTLIEAVRRLGFQMAPSRRDRIDWSCGPLPAVVDMGGLRECVQPAVSRGNFESGAGSGGHGP